MKMLFVLFILAIIFSLFRVHKNQLEPVIEEAVKEREYRILRFDEKRSFSWLD